MISREREELLKAHLGDRGTEPPPTKIFAGRAHFCRRGLRPPIFCLRLCRVRILANASREEAQRCQDLAL
jgi:hypothetical protein